MRARAAWATLGIAATDEVAAIRRAYADRLRAMDPDADPAAFDRLRQARAVALAAARDAAAPAEPLVDETPLDVFGDPWNMPLPIPGAPIVVPPVDAEDARGIVTVGEPGLVAAPPIAHAGSSDGPAIDAALPPATLGPAEIAAPMPPGDVGIPAPDAAARVEAAYERIVALLLPDGEWSADALDVDEQEALDAALAIVTADPRLEELAFRASAERWFAAVFSDAIPRSDPAIPRIVELFGWRDRARQIGEDYATEQVVDRARALHFVAAVQDPGHRFHKAWAELTDAVPERRFAPWRASRRSQRELLDQIRSKLPALEDWLSPARVAGIEKQVSGPGVPTWAMILVAIALLRLCAQVLPDQPTDGNVSVPVMKAGESQPLALRDTDLDVALLDVANGFTADAVRRSNPALFLVLDRMWQDAHLRGERVEPFRRQVSAYLDGQLRRAILEARYDDIAAYRRLEQVTLRKLAALDTGQCATARAADPALTLTDAQRQQRRALHARMLLAVAPGMTPTRERTFRVPGEAMAMIGTATGLPRAAVSQALGYRGDPAAICRVHAALIDAALKLPRKEGLPLLRAM